MVIDVVIDDVDVVVVVVESRSFVDFIFVADDYAMFDVAISGTGNDVEVAAVGELAILVEEFLLE